MLSHEYIMSMETSKDLSQKVDEASKALGIKRQELIDRALLVYLDNLAKYINLKREMKIWDELSDEALENFENSV